MLSKFPNLRKGEKVVTVLRRHQFYYIKHMSVLILLFAIPIAVDLVGRYFFDIFSDPSFNIIYIIIASIYYCFVLFFSFISWLDYYLDVWVITNQRIIEYEQKSIFNRETSELTMQSIQDVTAQIKGVIPSVFHFGDVHVQTAGTQERFIFKDTPNPDEAKKIIMDLHNESLQWPNNQNITQAQNNQQNTEKLEQ